MKKILCAMSVQTEQIDEKYYGVLCLKPEEHPQVDLWFFLNHVSSHEDLEVEVYRDYKKTENIFMVMGKELHPEYVELNVPHIQTERGKMELVFVNGEETPFSRTILFIIISKFFKGFRPFEMDKRIKFPVMDRKIIRWNLEDFSYTIQDQTPEEEEVCYLMMLEGLYGKPKQG